MLTTEIREEYLNIKRDITSETHNNFKWKWSNDIQISVNDVHRIESNLHIFEYPELESDKNYDIIWFDYSSITPYASLGIKGKKLLHILNNQQNKNSENIINYLTIFEDYTSHIDEIIHFVNSVLFYTSDPSLYQFYVRRENPKYFITPNKIWYKFESSKKFNYKGSISNPISIEALDYANNSPECNHIVELWNDAYMRWGNICFEDFEWKYKLIDVKYIEDVKETIKEYNEFINDIDGYYERLIKRYKSARFIS